MGSDLRGYIQRFIRPGDTVVDVACGYGEFINNIHAKNKIALDINQDARFLLDPDIKFYEVPATDLASVVAGEADVVFTSNFLEHLPDKTTLDNFLEQVHKSLKAGGVFIVMGPNLRYLPGEYWDFYDHNLALTHLSLSEALQLKGFTVDLCVDKFLPYTTQGALPTHPLLVGLYLRMPLVWRIFGKQFFLVARK
ncbi:MAG: methyltransferase domain-containing protein [Chlorobi bacterium]|nr:methyltransferase domain-containing protein [Chlorobiota bacterium]